MIFAFQVPNLLADLMDDLVDLNSARLMGQGGRRAFGAWRLRARFDAD
jgi:hypothetical protein